MISRSLGPLERRISLYRPPLRLGRCVSFLGCVLYVSNSWLSKHAKILAATVLAIFASIYYLKINSPLLTHYSYLCGVYLLFLAIGERGSVILRFGSSTMGIYLLHFPGVLKATAFATALAFDNTLFSYYLLVVLGTLLCSWWLTRLLMKVPHAHYLFGETGQRIEVARI